MTGVWSEFQETLWYGFWTIQSTCNHCLLFSAEKDATWDMHQAS